MKLLNVIPAYLPAYRYGGPIQSVHNLGKALTALGVNVTVYTTNANGDRDSDVPTSRAVHTDGLIIHYFPVSCPRSYFYSPELRRALNENLHQFDLIHIYWLYVYPTAVAARACIANHIPYVLSPYGMLDEEAVASRSTSKKHFYLNLCERVHIRGARVVHCTSEGERDRSLYRRWWRDVAVVPDGIDADEVRAGADADAVFDRFPKLRTGRIALCLGRLSRIKGPELLLDAWPEVVSRVPDAHLVIAGPDEDGYEKRIRSWINRSNMDGRVTVTGMLGRKEATAMLMQAKLLVSPSRMESFGMSIVEAMACGRPVVVTPGVGIHREIAQAQAGLVVPRTAPDLARGMIEILMNPDMAERMGKNGRRLVAERFTSQAAARQMMDVYRRILAD